MDNELEFVFSISPALYTCTRWKVLVQKRKENKVMQACFVSSGILSRPRDWHAAKHTRKVVYPHLVAVRFLPTVTTDNASSKRPVAYYGQIDESLLLAQTPETTCSPPSY